MAGPAGEAGQQIAERLSGAFHARRHNAGRDHRRLEQTQVVAREIENLSNRADLHAGLEIGADQAQHRLVNDAEPGFDGRLRCAQAPHAQVNRDVEHAGAFREIHPEKEDVAPTAVAQVHADRRGLTQDGKRLAGGVARQQFGANTNGASSG